MQLKPNAIGMGRSFVLFISLSAKDAVWIYGREVMSFQKWWDCAADAPPPDLTSNPGSALTNGGLTAFCSGQKSATFLSL
jgi:hypothetical protein